MLLTPQLEAEQREQEQALRLVELQRREAEAHHRAEEERSRREELERQ